jgi:hypothetical protein
MRVELTKNIRSVLGYRFVDYENLAEDAAYDRHEVYLTVEVEWPKVF